MGQRNENGEELGKGMRMGTKMIRLNEGRREGNGRNTTGRNGKREDDLSLCQFGYQYPVTPVHLICDPM